MTKLKYIIDKNYDGLMIFQMLKNQKDKKGIEYQAKVMNINFELAIKISKTKNFEYIKKEIEKLVNNTYTRKLILLEISKKDYQKSWDEINDRFFVRLEKITNFPIQHKIFKCVISAFHPGISNWGGNKIVRQGGLDPFKQRCITAHEIMISHLFSLVKNKYSHVDNDKIWPLAEIFSFAETRYDRVMNGFWPWDKNINIYDHNYQKLVGLQKKLTPILLNQGVEKFIEEGLKQKNRLGFIP